MNKSIHKHVKQYSEGFSFCPDVVPLFFQSLKMKTLPQVGLITQICQKVMEIQMLTPVRCVSCVDMLESISVFI